MFWLCLRFAQLALDVVRAGLDASSRKGPLAVVDGPTQRRQVVLADAAARKAGVHAGQPLAAAHLLCPRLAGAPGEAPVRDEMEREQDEEAPWNSRLHRDYGCFGPEKFG